MSIDKAASAAAGEQGPSMESDSEAEEIFNDIARFRAEGPAKPTHTQYTTQLWRREGEFWNL